MGCAASRLDDKPTVALCRDRCNFLDDALRHSYALADAHLAYTQSLNALGPSLHRFFDQISNSKSSPPAPASPARGLSRSSSGSHIRFNSDSEEEDRDGGYGAFHQIPCNYQSSGISNGLFSNYPVYGTSSPPPPPASDSSAWDFLNFFQMFDKFETAPDIPSSELKEVKEKCGEKNHGKEKELGQNGKKIEAEKISVNNVDMEKEPDSKNIKSSAASEAQIDSSGVSEVIREVQVQFEKAAKSGSEVLKLLDAGEFRYDHKNSVYQVSLKALHVVSKVSSDSLESKHSAEKISSVFVGLDDVEEMGTNSGNLSATLKKLCMWEKKLYDEVKAEEKLCMIHEKKSRLLKQLDEKGAEAAHKVDAVRTLVRTINTKRKIAFQVIDKLSITISKTRDEELWPWITKLIQGFLEMWKTMLECQRHQHQAIAEAKALEAIACDVKLSDACLEATMQLRFQIRNWVLSFSNWIDVQRCYVKALNGWLSRCLLHEPEETADGPVPFSPGRIGAPPVFVICDEWSQAMDRLSDKDVIEGMEGFATVINHLLEQHSKDNEERVITDKELERRLKNFEREEQKMQKIVQGLEKNRILLTGERRGSSLFSTVHHSHVTNSANLHLSLKQIFNAMESFAAKSLQAYDELQASIKEDDHDLDNLKLHKNLC